MASNGRRSGGVREDDPDWAPLLQVVGVPLASWFMWMFATQHPDGPVVHAYKHTTTRNYLFLDGAGRAYRDDGCGGHTAQPTSVAVACAFAGWERGAPSEVEVSALRAALRVARGGAR